MPTRFVVVSDEPHPCPYLPGRTARLPLKLPMEALSPEELDDRLALGERRAGPTFYRPRCPTCAACEALRVPTGAFLPSRSQRRVARRNEGRVEVRLRPGTATDRHVEIFNRHKGERGLSEGDDDLDRDTFRRYYLDSGVDTREVAYLVEGRLVAFSVVDLGRRSVSSVYHAFDPDEGRRSLGVYSVLAEVELFGRLGFEWYYLGLHVADCSRLAYKASYHPHERLGPEGWRRFEEPEDGGHPR